MIYKGCGIINRQSQPLLKCSSNPHLLSPALFAETLFLVLYGASCLPLSYIPRFSFLATCSTLLPVRYKCQFPCCPSPTHSPSYWHLATVFLVLIPFVLWLHTTILSCFSRVWQMLFLQALRSFWWCSPGSFEIASITTTTLPLSLCGLLVVCLVLPVPCHW